MKILGVMFHVDISKTVKINAERTVTCIKTLFKSNQNRLLTVQQRVTFVNIYALPLLGFIARTLPVPAEACRSIQTEVNRFVWRGQHEQLSVQQVCQPVENGGLGLINIKIKSKALFHRTFVKHLLDYNNPQSSQLDYLTGMSNPFRTNNNLPKKEKVNKIFNEVLHFIKKHKATVEEWRMSTTKGLYECLLGRDTRKAAIEIKYPALSFNKIFINITNNHLPARVKEHFFLATHNLLPTRERLRRCGYTNNGACSLCGEADDYYHHLWCSESQPICRWLARKIAVIWQHFMSMDKKEVFKGNFKVNINKIHNTVTWLVANFSLSLWKARKKIVGRPPDRSVASDLTKEVTKEINDKTKKLNKQKNRHFVDLPFNFEGMN